MTPQEPIIAYMTKCRVVGECTVSEVWPMRLTASGGLGGEGACGRRVVYDFPQFSEADRTSSKPPSSLYVPATAVAKCLHYL